MTNSRLTDPEVLVVNVTQAISEEALEAALAEAEAEVKDLLKSAVKAVLLRQAVSDPATFWFYLPTASTRTRQSSTNLPRFRSAVAVWRNFGSRRRSSRYTAIASSCALTRRHGPLPVARSSAPVSRQTD